MRNFFVTTLLTTTLVVSAQAQEETKTQTLTKGDVEFGINTGINITNISDSDNSAGTNTTFNFGGSVDYYFSDRWSIKGKLIYDRKGWDDDAVMDSNGNFVKTDINANYLTIPVMANWHFGSKRNWYLNFGPYAGVLLNAKETKFDSDVTKYLSSSDFGLSLGIGVKVPVSDKLKLFFEYEEQYGLTDVIDVAGVKSTHNVRSAFNVGLNFRMK